MKFVKMHGAGNDYIFVEAAKEAMTERLIIALCDRHKGVGGDGVVRIGESFLPTQRWKCSIRTPLRAQYAEMR